MIEAKGKGKLQTYWIAPEVELSYSAKSYESRTYRYGRQSSVADPVDDSERSLVDRAVGRLVIPSRPHSDGKSKNSPGRSGQSGMNHDSSTNFDSSQHSFTGFDSSHHSLGEYTAEF